MGDPQGEVFIRSRMALSTGLNKAFLGDERSWIIAGENAMKPMAIRTTCHQGGITQFFDLPMVTFEISLGRNGKHFVSFHHLFIIVALETDLCMKLLPELGHFGLIPF